MSLAAASLFEDLLGCPVEITEVIGQEDTGKESRGTGSAPHSERYLVVEPEVESRGKNAADGKDIHVGGQDEIVLELRTEVGIAARGVNAKVLGNSGVDGEVKPHGEADGVEAGTEIGGGRRKAEVQGPALG
jgi:hypothetical protein